MSFALFPFILLLAATAPAAASTAETPAAEAPKPQKEKKICRRDDTIGSRLGAKTCRTKAQWDAERQGRADDRSARDLNSKGGQ